MVALGFDKKIAKIVLNVIDKTLGKKFPLIDKVTDLFQEQQIQDKKVRDFEEDVCCAESANDKKTFAELRENSKSLAKIKEEKDENF